MREADDELSTLREEGLLRHLRKNFNQLLVVFIKLQLPTDIAR